jgi:hypothetical protein
MPEDWFEFTANLLEDRHPLGFGLGLCHLLRVHELLTLGALLAHCIFTDVSLPILWMISAEQHFIENS